MGKEKKKKKDKKVVKVKKDKKVKKSKKQKINEAKNEIKKIVESTTKNNNKKIEIKNTVSYEQRMQQLSPIANPVSSEVMSHDIYKLTHNLCKNKLLKRGVKEVVKAMRKNQISSDKCICIIAGDVSPVEVVAHIPIMCEDREIPYIYVPSKHDLGHAACTKRPTSVVFLIKPKDSNDKTMWKNLYKEVQSLAPTF